MAIAFWICACAPSPTPPRRVFLITVDTLRADHLGFHGYARDTSPHLDALAARSLVFERAIAQWPRTGASLASVFTGLYPQTTGLTHRAAIELPDSYLTLPELFRELGYRTAAVVANPLLPARLGWDQGFDEYLETWSGMRPESLDRLHASRVNKLALPLLERHAAEPLFIWIHYFDPHPPFEVRKGESPFVGDPHYDGGREIGRWFPRRFRVRGQKELSWYVAQYDGNVRVADHWIGELLEDARRLGLLDESLIVFTSDHGEGLGDHDYMLHGRLPHNAGSHVPLLFFHSSARTRGTRIERPVELIDLYPTLRDLVAPARVVEGLEGESLAGYLHGEAPPVPSTVTSRYAFSEAGMGRPPALWFRSLQDLEWKLVYHPPWQARGRKGQERFELYDLRRDPGESQNLYAPDHPEAQRLRRALSTWLKPPQGEIPEEWQGRQDRETREMLRALGYIQ